MKNKIEFYGKITGEKREYKDPEYRQKVIEFFGNHDGKEFSVTYKIINDIKSYAQLKFFYGVVVPAFVQATGETNREMIARYLKGKYLGRIEEIMGETIPYVPSLAMDKNEIDKLEMANFISNCLNELYDVGGSIDQHEIDKLHSVMQDDIEGQQELFK